MKMKDKLVKFHHKGHYYRARKFLIAVVAVFSLGSMIAIPTYIISNSTATTASAEERENVETEEIIEEENESTNSL